MQSRQKDQLTQLIKICERIHAEIIKACPYASNRHPESGYMGNNHFSHSHNLLWSAVRSRKTSTVEMVNVDKTVTIPAKEFVLNHMKIDIHHFPKDEHDESIMDALNKQVLDLTDCKLILYELEDILDTSSICDKTARKDGSEYTEKHQHEAIAKNIQRYHVGNCSDRTKYSLVAAMEFPIDHFDLSDVCANNEGITLEYFALNEGFNHAFTVVNRDLNSNPQDPKTWGENAIIIDSWWNLHSNTTSQGVFVVADELRKLETNEKSSLFEYIMDAVKQDALTNYDDPPYYFGEGHTKEWLESTKKGKHAESLCDYSDITNASASHFKMK